MNKPELSPESNYQHTVASLRREMSAGSRLFSSFIHIPIVDRLSDFTAKTIGRPSLLLGAVTGGLVFGATLYIYGRHYGLWLQGSEIVIGLIIGAFTGLLIEGVIRFLKA